MSSPRSDFFVPPGYSAPLAVVTDTDHSARLFIATVLGLSWTLLFAAIRIFIHGHGETGSYQMSNLQSGTTGNAKHISAPTFDGNGDAYGGEAWVTVEVINNRDGKERDTTRRTSGDETSYDSSDSDRMVIKKDTTFLVAHGD